MGVSDTTQQGLAQADLLDGDEAGFPGAQLDSHVARADFGGAERAGEKQKGAFTAQGSVGTRGSDPREGQRAGQEEEAEEGHEGGRENGEEMQEEEEEEGDEGAVKQGTGVGRKKTTRR